jgi:mRNA interferase MazF
VTYECFDVVVVPFPFADRKATRRPALIFSTADTFGDRIGNPVLATITSQGNISWALDVPITDGVSTGLSAPSVVRMKLFTLDHRLILRKAGRLAHSDQKTVVDVLNQLLGIRKQATWLDTWTTRKDFRTSSRARSC